WFFFFQAEDGIRDLTVTGVQTCALPISVIRRAELHGARRDEVDYKITAHVADILTRGRERVTGEGGRDVVAATSKIRESVMAARIGLRRQRTGLTVGGDADCDAADRAAINSRHHAAQVDCACARVAVEHAVLIA